MTTIKKPMGRVAYDEVQSKKGAIRLQAFTNALAADADLILNDESINGAAHSVTTFLAQPDFARNLTVVASGAATGDVVVTGTNIRGDIITETLALNGNTPVVGNKAFKTVTSVAVPQVSSTTIDLGIGVKLGLDRKMPAAAVLDAYADGVRETTAATVAFSATAIESNTVSTNTAPNGTRDFIVAFITAEITNANQTTA
ncbi:hypothetical protein [Streptomyces cinereoruber]|uniref:hypothetical protein n=1 Tax=Streptomyces cinereoruber TaxID=67260 RepID=UPI0036274BFE